MSLRLWPGSLKCCPVASLLVLIYPICYDILLNRLLSLSPIYLSLHLSFVHCIIYTMFCVLQLSGLLMLHVNLSDFICFPSFMNGQMIHDLPHLNIPFILLFGYGPIGGGTLALII